MHAAEVEEVLSSPEPVARKRDRPRIPVERDLEDPEDDDLVEVLPDSDEAPEEQNSSPATAAIDVDAEPVFNVPSFFSIETNAKKPVEPKKTKRAGYHL